MTVRHKAEAYRESIRAFLEGKFTAAQYSDHFCKCMRHEPLGSMDEQLYLIPSDFRLDCEAYSPLNTVDDWSKAEITEPTLRKEAEKAAAQLDEYLRRGQMRKGHCPQCGSTEVYRGSHAPLEAGEGLLHLSLRVGNRYINALLDAYVCRNCGYTELYAANLEKVASLPEAQGWEKVAA